MSSWWWLPVSAGLAVLACGYALARSARVHRTVRPLRRCTRCDGKITPDRPRSDVNGFWCRECATPAPVPVSPPPDFDEYEDER